MNKAKLRTMEAKFVKLRPLPIRIDAQTGSRLNPIEDRWRISKSPDPNRILISISRTGHGLELPYDHIREYMEDASRESDGFLLLKAQLHLSGDRAWFEPIHTSN